MNVPFPAVLLLLLLLCPLRPLISHQLFLVLFSYVQRSPFRSSSGPPVSQIDCPPPLDVSQPSQSSLPLNIISSTLLLLTSIQLQPRPSSLTFSCGVYHGSSRFHWLTSFWHGNLVKLAAKVIHKIIVRQFFESNREYILSWM